MADITPRKRNRILALSEHCDYTQTAIANIVWVSQKSVSQIIKQQELTSSVTSTCKGKCGKKRKTKKDPRKTSFDL